MDVSLLFSAITAPAAGAAPLRFTVAIEVPPPLRDAGLIFTESSAAGFTVSVGLFVTVPRVAEIVTKVLLATG